ncbi:MAG: hypothetical protein ABI211_06170 [Vicinamibacterales bacterium]
MRPVYNEARTVRQIEARSAGRTYAEGKKIGWRDGLRALWCISRYRRPAAPAVNPLPQPRAVPGSPALIR